MQTILIKPHLNIIFIGHVDAGKSTIAGSILLQKGMVDPRVLEKYEKEAKDNNRASWHLAYIMDTDNEERIKGITVDVGRARFETDAKRYTILDAPGHKSYVPNMIGGAAQADVAILVISSRQGEFEAGFIKDGQTREHALLAKTIGIKKVIVAINKMDDNIIETTWSQLIYNKIVSKVDVFLKKECYLSANDIYYIPISGYTGDNITKRVSIDLCPWYNKFSLIELLDSLVLTESNINQSLRIPISDKYREKGMLHIVGKISSGSVKIGDNIILMPSRLELKLSTLMIDEKPAISAGIGENVSIGIASGVEELDISQGDIICDPLTDVVPVITSFEAQLVIQELLSQTALFTAGYKAIMHIHTCVREITVDALLSEYDKTTKKNFKRVPFFARSKSIITARLTTVQPVCMELFSTHSQLGRFILRDQGKTIAIGKVIKL